METLLQNLFMKHLTTNPNMRLYPVQSVIVLTVLLVFTAYLGRSVYRKKICLFAAYYPVCVVLYVAALYVTYVSTFSYEESIRNATGYRYLSVIVLYGFFVLTAMMLHTFGSEARPAGQLQEVRPAGIPDGQPIEGASGEAQPGWHPRGAGLAASLRKWPSGGVCRL
jgi:membrane protease YdiL (CAAX protease family)